MNELRTLNHLDMDSALTRGITVVALETHGCTVCTQWVDELQPYVRDQAPDSVRFFRARMDEPGLDRFKAAYAGWLRHVDVLPTTAVFVNGKLHKEFVGKGVGRVKLRIQSAQESQQAVAA